MLRRVALALCLSVAAATQAALVTGSQDINGNGATPKYTDNGKDYGPYGWSYSYTRSFDGTKFTKHLEIAFNFDAGLGYTDAQKQTYKNTAESNIEGVWNNKFFIHDDITGTNYPITVDVTTAGPTFNQTVNVKKAQGNGEPPYDMTHWYTDEDSPAGQAHEFGHMLGLYDEYIGGAVDKYPNPTLSDDGVMGLGANSATPVMYPRYYQQYLTYMQSINPDGSWSLIPVPEPATLTLLLAFAVAARRRNPQSVCQ